MDSVAAKTEQIERFQMKLSDFSGKQWRVLLILVLVNFVNYVDRQIVFSLFPAIRRDFGLSYVQLGYLATAFTVVLSLASFPLGMLADRILRRAVISVGVLFWSGATRKLDVGVLSQHTSLGKLK
ncbi:MAG: MFS transporter [Candidatus Sulfotelmatobacter sp.]